MGQSTAWECSGSTAEVGIPTSLLHHVLFCTLLDGSCPTACSSGWHSALLPPESRPLANSVCLCLTPAWRCAGSLLLLQKCCRRCQQRQGLWLWPTRLRCVWSACCHRQLHCSTSQKSLLVWPRAGSPVATVGPAALVLLELPRPCWCAASAGACLQQGQPTQQPAFGSSQHYRAQEKA